MDTGMKVTTGATAMSQVKMPEPVAAMWEDRHDGRMMPTTRFSGWPPFEPLAEFDALITTTQAEAYALAAIEADRKHQHSEAVQVLAEIGKLFSNEEKDAAIRGKKTIVDLVRQVIDNRKRRGEPVAWLHTVVQDDGEEDQALSFVQDAFPLEGVGGFRSTGATPLYVVPQPAEPVKVGARIVLNS